MDKTVKRKFSNVKIRLLSALLLLTFLLLPVACAVDVPPSTYLTMPTYETMFNFESAQSFTALYREESSNASYSEYWFFTLGRVSGWQAFWLVMLFVS